MNNKPRTFDEALPYLMEQQNAAAAAPPPQQAETIEEQPATEPAVPQQADASAPTTPENIASEAALRAAQQLGAAQQRIAQLEAQLQQQSQAAETTIQKQMEPPKIDFSEFNYLSDDERAQRQSTYAQEMAAYVAAQLDSKLKPVVETVAAQKQAAEETKAIDSIRAKSPDFDQYLPEIQTFLQTDNLIAAALNGLPALEKYATAYIMTKGAKPAEAAKTSEQLANEVANNPDAMRLLELKKAELLKQNKNVPAQAASAGMANIPVPAPNKPKNFDEANELVRKHLGVT